MTSPGRSPPRPKKESSADADDTGLTAEQSGRQLLEELAKSSRHPTLLPGVVTAGAVAAAADAIDRTPDVRSSTDAAEVEETIVAETEEAVEPEPTPAEERAAQREQVKADRATARQAKREARERRREKAEQRRAERASGHAPAESTATDEAERPAEVEQSTTDDQDSTDERAEATAVIPGLGAAEEDEAERRKAERAEAKRRERLEKAEAKARAKREKAEARAAARAEREAERADDLVGAPPALADADDPKRKRKGRLPWPTIVLGIAMLALVASVVLAIGALLAAVSADTDNAIVGAISSVCDVLDGPLTGLFDFSGDNAADKERLLSRGIASMLYLAVGVLLPLAVASRDDD